MNPEMWQKKPPSAPKIQQNY